MGRDYRKEYDNYHSSPKQKKNRAARNAARAAMVKSGRVKKGDGKDVLIGTVNLGIILVVIWGY